MDVPAVLDTRALLTGSRVSLPVQFAFVTSKFLLAVILCSKACEPVSLVSRLSHRYLRFTEVCLSLNRTDSNSGLPCPVHYLPYGLAATTSFQKDT
ncbi:hypothetical protein VTK56DRAFT_1347 [Thermocarpiscus australiensis]